MYIAQIVSRVLHTLSIKDNLRYTTHPPQINIPSSSPPVTVPESLIGTPNPSPTDTTTGTGPPPTTTTDLTPSADLKPKHITISEESLEILSNGLQLHIISILEDSLRYSRRRRNKSAVSSYGHLFRYGVGQ